MYTERLTTFEHLPKTKRGQQQRILQNSKKHISQLDRGLHVLEKKEEGRDDKKKGADQ